MQTQSFHHQLFESRRIVDQEGRSLSAEFTASEQWLSSPGCFVQANNRHFASSLSSDSVVKPGIFASVVLKGAGAGGPWGEQASVRIGDNTLVILALRRSTRWWGQIPGGANVQSVGLAFPSASFERLNLWDEYVQVFDSAAADVVTATMKASPRLRAIAAEMLSPPLVGNVGRLLLEAHASEVLAYSLSALTGGAGVSAINVNDRVRLHSVRMLINSDLRRTWSLADLAKEAGLSKRALNAKFRMAFGTTVADYLKQQRLEFARDALVHERLTVAEAAYCVGYEHPANFATAFRRHFGYAPSDCRKQDATRFRIHSICVPE